MMLWTGIGCSAEGATERCLPLAFDMVKDKLCFWSLAVYHSQHAILRFAWTQDCSFGSSALPPEYTG